MRKTMVFSTLILILVLMGANGCHYGVDNPSSTITTALSQNQQPIEVISVSDTHKSGETVNPGGPNIEITLKNISKAPVVSLSVTLEESVARYPFNFDYDVTSSNPLLPNKSISAVQRLIGGGSGDGTSYSLKISGTFQNGAPFSYTLGPLNNWN